MKRSPFFRQALAALALFAAAPALAQSADGNGCRPDAEIMADDQILFARTWLPMRIGIDMMRATCRAHDFVANLFKRQPDPDKATLDDVMEASKPDVTSTDARYQARLRDMPSPTKSPGWNQYPATSIVVLPPNTAGGVPVLFQPNTPGQPEPTSVSEIQGNGTLLSQQGIKRGTFVDGKLNGVGEEIDPDGTWRSGTYDRGTNVKWSLEVRIVDGKSYIAAGSVVDGKLDGMIERVFADGSTQFEDWEGGKLMQVGNRAAKGETALAPQTRYKAPEEDVAVEDAYKHTGPKPKIAPGTTITYRGANPNSHPTTSPGRLIWDACESLAEDWVRHAHGQLDLEKLRSGMLSFDPDDPNMMSKEKLIEEINYTKFNMDGHGRADMYPDAQQREDMLANDRYMLCHLERILPFLKKIK